MIDRPSRVSLRRALLSLSVLAALGVSVFGRDPVSRAATGQGHTAALVTPPDVKARGYLRVGTNPPYYPMEDYLPGTSTCCRGLDMDLATALASKLGVKTKFLAINDFGALIAGVNSGNYDLVMSSVTINPTRSKNMHFIEYLVVGEGIVVLKGNPRKISNAASLSGLDVALQSGTVEFDDAKAANKALAKAGKKSIKIHTFTSDADAVQALLTGQVAAKFDDFPIVANDVVRTRGRLQLAGPQFNAAPYGIAVPLKQTALYNAVKAAFAALRNDGSYMKLLKTYGLQSAAVGM